MSYVRYNESLYRTGFRPYGMTNPHGATQLGAIPLVDHSYGGFGPWQLHGYPFSESGGWALHGLGASGVPNGSLVTYRGVWTSMFNTGAGYKQKGDPQSLVDAVAAALGADGQLTVMQKPSGLTGLAETVGFTGPFNVTLVLQVTNGMGFGSVNDVISIIRHYVYQVSGVFPQSDTITQVVAPQEPTTSTDPNYQAAGMQNTPGLPSATQSPSAPMDWGSWISDNFGTIALAVGALAILPPLLKRVF